MKTHLHHSTPRRKLRPQLTLLEDRCTPTVTGIGLVAMTPGLGGGGKVSLGVVVSDSNKIAAETLSVSYKVVDSLGQTIDSGPITSHSSLPESTLVGYGKTLSLAATPGTTQAIYVMVTDADSMGVPMVTSTALVMPKTKGVTVMGVGVTEQSGDTYSGYGQGRIILTPLDPSGMIAKGSGSLHVVSGANNDQVLNLGVSGRFWVGMGPNGNIGMKASNATGVVNYASYAGDTTATGGFSAKVRGSLNITRYADQSIDALVKGDVTLQAQMNLNSTTPSNLKMQGRKVALSLKTDGNSHFKLGLSGKMNMVGNLNSLAIGLLG